jgi:hypothetical protein
LISPLRVDDDRLAAYRERGFVSLGTLLGPEDVTQLHDVLAALHEQAGENGSGVIVHDTWRREPLCTDVVCSKWLSSIACQLMDCDRVTLFQDNLVWKLPGSDRIEWHQDYSYQPLSEPKGVTLWLSLDHTVPQSGCLHYVVGSHRWGLRAPADFIKGTGQPTRTELQPLDIAAHRHEIEAVQTQPGEVIAHHPLVWHMSPQNRSQQHRRAISVNWIDPAVRWLPSQAPHPYNFELKPADGDPFDATRFPSFDVQTTPNL